MTLRELKKLNRLLVIHLYLLRKEICQMVDFGELSVHLQLIRFEYVDFFVHHFDQLLMSSVGHFLNLLPRFEGLFLNCPLLLKYILELAFKILLPLIHQCVLLLVLCAPSCSFVRSLNRHKVVVTLSFTLRDVDCTLQAECLVS